MACERCTGCTLALAGRGVEGRATSLVDGTDAGAGSAQEVDDIRVASRRGVVQRGAAMLVR